MTISLEEVKKEYQEQGLELDENSEKLWTIICNGLNEKKFTIDDVLSVIDLAMKEKDLKQL